MEKRKAIYESWGLKVEIGEHVFDKDGYLAGPDAARLADLNAAFRDPEVRTVIATRGGKGSYRIAGGIDCDAVRRDPKLLVGFSDITILHLYLWRSCRLAAIHGALMEDADGAIGATAMESHRRVLMDGGGLLLKADAGNPTARLTTQGKAEGILLGGNLDMIGTATSWALPDLSGAILLIEAVGMERGQVDRLMTMLARGGHLADLAGIAVGQFTGMRCAGPWNFIDIVRPYLEGLGVPILGGLPVGHGADATTIPVGTPARLDADAGTLRIDALAG